MSLLRSARHGVGVIGENSFPSNRQRTKQRKIQRYAKGRGRQYTGAKLEFEGILENLGNGALRGKYNKAHVFKNWILDFFLYEIRLGIDIDEAEAGSQTKKEQKAAECESAGIVFVRFSKQEVFGDQELLVNKLRTAYGEAKRRSRERK